LQAVSNEELSDILKKIDQTIETECNKVLQCKSIGVGSSPCGGVSEYKVYSLKKTNSIRLKSLVKTYNIKKAIKNKEDNIMGLCLYVTAPKTSCVNEHCLAVDGIK
jgi:hypothetical protein